MISYYYQIITEYIKLDNECYKNNKLYIYD